MSRNPKLEPGQWFAKAQSMASPQLQDARAASLRDPGSNLWLWAATDASIEECLQSQARPTRNQRWWMLQGFKLDNKPAHGRLHFVIDGWQTRQPCYPPDVLTSNQQRKYREQSKIAIALNPCESLVSDVVRK